ncbi:MAG: RNA methyltransferase [Muribaculaceae bacterium]|nr:RNA methyltransferase [Muribaculaceae bacterium]
MEMTANLRKMVVSLDMAKHRRQTGLFKAEGTKCVVDTLGSFDLKYLICLDEWWKSHEKLHCVGIDPIIVKRMDMERMSTLSTPSPVIAVYEIPERSINETDLSEKLVIALDTVQDPGNLGTIVRAADWFGVTDLICSHETADIYNPKSVMATMGAISRVNVHYCDLSEILPKIDSTIYGTFLDGESIYDTELSHKGVIVMGNEGRGISDSLASSIDKRILIPSYPADRVTSESLNVGVATAIVLSEFRRRTYI